MVDISRDPWIIDLPLARWPTFVSMEVVNSMYVCDLLQIGRDSWNAGLVSGLFEAPLAKGALSLAVPMHSIQDVSLHAEDADQGAL